MIKAYDDNGNIVDIEGYVVKSNVCYKRITYVKPVKRDYSDKRHLNYYKYTCPICDMLNNEHQVNIGDTNCALCNINLIWDYDIKEQKE